jgi:hypothetical protein
MLKRSLLLALLVSCAAINGRSQAVKSQPEKSDKPASLDADKLIREWFRRLNALDNWFITVDGKEEPEGVVNSMVDLYAPDALQFVGPGEDQLGTVTLSGQVGIRKWADDFARKYVQLAWRLQDQTVQEKTADLIMTTIPPWGGLAASVEFTAFWGERETRRRFFGPGIASFQFNESGKIRRLRIYLPKDEIEEVVP